MKNVAIVLGGTNPHIQLLRKLKERGYYTVLVDYYPNPPAKPYADEHVQESTMDKEVVLEIAKLKNADLVITTNIDQANTTACYVAEKLHLPHPYSYETSLNVTDKSRMKTMMWENGISTSMYLICNSLKEIQLSDLTFPLVVKPADSNGSRGVYKCSNIQELFKYFNLSKEASKNGKVIIEGYVDGTEVSFYYFIQEGKAHYITSNQRFRFKTGTAGVIQSAGGLYPVALSKNIYEKMQINADRIAKVFNLDNTPIFIQAIATDDNIYVIEFAPRIGGGLSYRLIENENQFDIINAAIDSFLGKKAALNIFQPDQYSAVMNVYAPGIVMGHFYGIDEITSKGIAKEFYPYKMPGSEVSKDMSSGSRVGAFFIQGKTEQDIYNKIYFINESIEVYDSFGRPSMQHDIYNL